MFYYLRLMFINICYYFFSFFLIPYPFWFLKLFMYNNIIIQIPCLYRNKTVSDNYKKFIMKSNGIKTFTETLFVNEELYVLRKNDYPYNIGDNILHYVLWLKDKKNHDFNELNSIIKEQIVVQFKVSKEFAFSENIYKNKSIPEVQHYHVFILK